MKKTLETTGLKAGKDFHLAFSPERENRNSPHISMRTIPKVLGGVTPHCLMVARALYDRIVDRTVAVSSTKTAQAAKLLENILHSLSIALVNEMKMLFDRKGINVREVISAVAISPFGYTPCYPGPGKVLENELLFTLKG